MEDEVISPSEELVPDGSSEVSIVDGNGVVELPPLSSVLVGNGRVTVVSMVTVGPLDDVLSSPNEVVGIDNELDGLAVTVG